MKKSKSKSKEKPAKRSKKNQVPEDQLPSLVEGMTKLVERLESLERKMDQVLGRVSNLSSRPQNSAAPFQQRAESQSQPEMRPERTLYQAICADCHKNCEVPFKPGNRPIYCKECFAIRKAGHRKHSVDLTSLPPKKPNYTPPVLTTEAIPSLKKAEMTVFEKSKKKKSAAKAKKSGKRK